MSNELNQNQIQTVLDLGNKTGESWNIYQSLLRNFPELKILSENLKLIQPDLEYEFTPCIVRGIAYYTGLVYEVFDKNPTNPRALLGGGRYDNLLEMFGTQTPAIGFGSGDVTMNEFLEYWKLYPDNLNGNTVKVGLMLDSQDSLYKTFSQIIPDLISKNQSYEINYEYQRSENKRYEALKKRGCDEIIKVS
jgi:histidyl-tRNA synthetase